MDVNRVYICDTSKHDPQITNVYINTKQVCLLLQFKMIIHYDFKGKQSVLNVINYNFALNELLE
jgi:hypothetical protein